MRSPTILAVIPGVPLIPILLAYIGAVSLIWTTVHGRYLYCQWREEGRPPGVFGRGFWALFASLATVCLVGFARNILPDAVTLRAVIELALLAVAITVTWLAIQLLKHWR